MVTKPFTWFPLKCIKLLSVFHLLIADITWHLEMCESMEAASNIIMPDGTCRKCENRVYSNFVSCLVCKSKFHATGCSNDIDICTPTFLNLFKPFSEKVAPKYAARPGNFHFLCDACLTTFEINKAASDNDKVDSLTTKVNNLENGLNEIKSMLRSQASDPVSNTVLVTKQAEPNTLVSSHSKNPWSLSNMCAPLDMDTVEKIDNDKQLSAIVIPAIENDILKKSQMKVINRAVMQSKVSIRNSFQKKNGDTVILCDSDQTRDSLKAEIANVAPDIEVKSPDKRRDTIAVVGLDDNYDDMELMNCLVDQNFFLKAFAALHNLSDHIKYVDTKPLRNDSERFQATFRISKELRQVLKQHNDRLIVGVISCRVYNRMFVKRCAICQRFGHFFAQCKFKDEPKCAFCGCDHETKDCLKNCGKKCINCARANHDNTDHKAFSKHCPEYLKALENLKRALN